MGLTGIAKLPKGPSAAVRRRMGRDQAGGAAFLPADALRRVSPAWRSAEVSQCGELLDALARQGVRVSVRAGSLIITGKPRTMAGAMALETLRGREPAVERALAVAFERGPELARLLAARRESAAERRRGRKPRLKKNLSEPTVGVVRSNRRESSGLNSPACPPPSAPIFALDRETP